MTNQKMSNKNFFIALIGGMLSFFSFSQELTAEIDGYIPVSGFYQIMVNPKIRAYSNNDFSDFRIYDSKKKEVPYLLKQYNSESVYQKIQVLKVVDKISKANEYSSYIIETNSKKINALTLEIANTNINKTFSISGSNDLQNWYGISMNNLADLSDENSDSNILLNVDFPSFSYKYIKFVFDDKKTLPIQVLKFYLKENFLNTFKTVPIAIKSFKSEVIVDKKTRLVLEFFQPETIDLISFKINSPQLFQRDITIYGVKNKNELTAINRLTLNHQSLNNIAVSVQKHNKIYIDIDNLDSPPLEIKGVLCYQKPLFVSAWLNPNETYLIKTNLLNMKQPIYDLAFFENDIEKNQIIGLQMKNIKVEDTKLVNKLEQKNALWQHPWFMWLCIAIGGLTILYFVRSLIKDMRI